MKALPNGLTLSNGKYFLICQKAWSLYWAVRHKSSICFLKFKALWIVIPSNSTSSDSLTVIVQTFRLYFKQFFFPSIINWSFPGFAFDELILNQWRRFFTSCSRLFRIKWRLLPWENKVLSSTKLQMSDFSTTGKVSLIKVLKSNGPWGIPWMTLLVQSLYAEPIFVLFLR